MKPLQVLIALFTFAFLPLHAASLDDLTYTTTDGEVTITDCDQAATGEIVIPNTIGGNPVSSIGNYAFEDCTALTSMTIPDGVTSIEGSAFLNCNSLTNITIPDSVTSIGGGAFQNCSSLPSITIPNGVTSIGGGAFQRCSSLTSITIPDKVTSIGAEAFFECIALTSITIPDSVTSIGEYAFYNCTSLTSIMIPDSVTSIDGYAFYECTNLTNITMPDGVTNIGEGAFQNCSSLPSITIPDKVTSIGAEAFQRCSSLTSITIPDKVTSIGAEAFFECTALTSVSFQGVAPPNRGFDVFSGLPEGAKAYVSNEAADSFGGVGSTWEGLTVAIESIIDLNDGQLGALYESPTGESITIDATPAAGFPAEFTYQWCFNGFKIPANLGGTGSSFSIDSIAGNEGTWSVTVTNETGSVEQSFEYRIYVDSDSDGLSDAFEELVSLTNINNSDTDNDGLADGDEVNTYRTNPNSSDSDSDGFTDLYELETAYDPNSAESTPDAQVNIMTAIEVDFNAALGATYEIQFSTDTIEWTVIEAGIVGEGNAVERLYSRKDFPTGFFRVERTDQ